MTWKGRPTAYERILSEEGGVAEHSHYCRYCKRTMVCRSSACGSTITDRVDKDGRSEGQALPICSLCTGGTVTGSSTGSFTLTMGMRTATNTFSYTFPVSSSGVAWNWDGVPVGNGVARRR